MGDFTIPQYLFFGEQIIIWHARAWKFVEYRVAKYTYEVSLGICPDKQIIATK